MAETINKAGVYLVALLLLLDLKDGLGKVFYGD
jgi:hypothetical protein